MLGHRQRIAAFRTQLQLSRPGIEIRDVVELPIDETKSRRIVAAALRKHPCRYILYSGNAKAGITAIRTSGLETASIFYDLSAASREALRDGVIDAVIYQNPHRQGYRAVEILFEYFTANKRPATNPEMNDCAILLRESL